LKTPDFFTTFAPLAFHYYRAMSRLENDLRLRLGN
jgi:hypothetical protein